MENRITISKPGKSKQQLMDCLESLKSEFADQISENDVKITRLSDGFSINGKRKVLFLNFWINAKIITRDTEFELNWDTNAPEGKVREAMEKVKSILEKC